MKKIITDTILIDYDGNPVVEQGKPITLRLVLRTYAGSFVPEQGNPKAIEESVIANAVALKIHDANGAVELTDEEYNILKKTISIPRHVSMVYGQVHAAVMDAEKTK